LRIAQVAPLFESVPPQAYGGTERVVDFLTEELVAMGHDVTLFASGDSKTSARLVPCCEHSLRTDPNCKDPIAYHMVMLDMLAKRRDDFDIIHFHIDYLHFPLSRVMGWPQLTTLHGRLDLPDLVPVYQQFRDTPLVSISDSQRAPVPQANFVATVHHGLPVDLLKFSPKGGDYFAFLGRISPEKRVDRAIEIAIALNVPLKIAAKLDKADREYHESGIVHLLEHPLVEFVGEIGDDQKSEFLGNARALLFPIDWPEPFGLVVIESMACGTPVVAFRCGAVPEVLEDGVSGYVVDDMDAAIEAARKIDKLSRFRVREAFEKRFTARRMAEDYVAIYRSLGIGENALRESA
jgi:glycosyltransferase involved in cell wall biosynthesis